MNKMALRFLPTSALVVVMLGAVKSQLQPQFTSPPNNGAGVTVSQTTDPNAISGILGSLANPPGGTTTIAGSDLGMNQWPGVSGGYPAYPNFGMGGFGNGGFGGGGFFGNPWGNGWPMFPPPRPPRGPRPPMFRPIYIPVPVPVANGFSLSNNENGLSDDTIPAPKDGHLSQDHKEDQHKGPAPTELHNGKKDANTNNVTKPPQNGKPHPPKDSGAKTTTAHPIK